MSSTDSERAFDQLCAEVLTLIEVAETRSLAWGFTSVLTSPEQLPDPATALPEPFAVAWRAGGHTLASALANLEARKLLFRQGDLYRSRFAETVRLLALLRQRFSDRDWQTASTLVNDWKLHLQRRRYPRRDVAPSVMLGALRAIHVSSDYLEVVRCLLMDARGESLSVATFQREAIVALPQALGRRHDSGIVIGAGTGAGKTKAFYMPAFAAIATRESSGAVDVLALYPRVELLKDQLAEAYTEARKLDAYFSQHRHIPLTVGAYFEDTPYSAAQSATGNLPRNWTRSHAHEGWICPFFSCPNPDCIDNRMLWADADIEREREANTSDTYGIHERLRCLGCGAEVQGNTLRLTRAHMQRHPPDVLFTTTEMLNRRLSNAREHSLFGIGAAQLPRMVLLDEVHTYEGVRGAQVAYLLRRWRHARGFDPRQPLVFVGLSATLTDAEQFFATLTGLPRHAVTYIKPGETELTDEGVEYNLVLRGDPVSGTALLSTSVQTTMLLGRMLDPWQRGAPRASTVSHGAIGQKIFAFTDTLDVINRWYHIEDDAERRQRLSQYRLPPVSATSDELRHRRAAGQLWRVCEEIGHDLRTPLRIGLTTSQYRGVETDASVVIATSTLEVGFNDASVGAVIQHKAPRSLASFLQRKGRAGRTRTMRPWTVVVASAYGRDRWAFQHAEALFTPTLPPTSLPLDNRYVQRIQASYALMDWLCLSLKREGDTRIDIWALLSNGGIPSLRGHAARMLDGVLDGSRLAELRRYLERALALSPNDEEVIRALLWGQPRALLLDVVPTVLRQLETDWRRVTASDVIAHGDQPVQTPMAEFVPPNLFTDLNLPEVTLILPNGTEESLALIQSLVEFAPGHVSKRYARRERTTEAHWLALPDTSAADDDAVPLSALAIRAEALQTPVLLDGVAYHVTRPWAYTLATVPVTVLSTSSARLRWRSLLTPHTAEDGLDRISGCTEEPTGVALNLLAGSPWRRLVREIRVHRQESGDWVDVQRLAVGVHAQTRYTNGREVRRTVRFSNAEQPAALGFSLAVDALAFTIAPLDVAALRSSTTWRSLYATLAPHIFLDRLRRHPRIVAAQLSTFEIEWLWQLEFSMLIAVAITSRCTLAEAKERVEENRQRIADRTLEVIFQTRPFTDDDADDEHGRLHRKLTELISEPFVQEALRDSVRTLWDDRDADDYLHACYADSMGAALFTAVTRFVPSLDTNELALDVVDDRVWISEQSAGGVGLVAMLADAIAREPRSFDLCLQDAVRHCDREHLAGQLSIVAENVDDTESELAKVFQSVRDGMTLQHPDAIRYALGRALEDAGITPTREVVVAINTKFLRPNSEFDSDALIAALVRLWMTEETRLSCVIDPRVMAVAAWRDEDIRARVEALCQRIGGIGAAMPENHAFNMLQSLLWLTCHDSCPDCIAVQQRFWDLTHPSRLLLRAVLHEEQFAIAFGSEAWKVAMRRSLSETQFARLFCTDTELLACKAAVQQLLTTPLEIGYQLFYPMVEGIYRTQTGWVIALAIGELTHG